MREPEPIIVIDLFPEVLDGLLEVLTSLAPSEWDAPTVCRGWTVKDIALHLLGGDISLLSRKRDEHRFSGSAIKRWDELVDLINELNDTWVKATRRLSPRLVTDLLAFTGPQVNDYFASLDPYAMGDPVDWAGAGPAPVWLDLAREYTEKWHHQQQIRDAVGRPGLKEKRYFAPLLDTFVRALPRTYSATRAPAGTTVALTITGDAGGTWFLVSEGEGWKLYLDPSGEPQSEVVIDQDAAWRLFTKGISGDEANATVTGDAALGRTILDTVSVIA
ncbi:MAG TPA: maleylpyruvate isomerase N-terminal domain-containing protein [Blastocatellia bacterium]|nr:maleylpyruvate isomerase N-terminal domain-containing protein [Blastocatellia bacterium]